MTKIEIIFYSMIYKQQFRHIKQLLQLEQKLKVIFQFLMHQIQLIIKNMNHYIKRNLKNLQR